LANNSSLLAAVCRRVPEFDVENHRLATGLCVRHRDKFTNGTITDDDLVNVRDLLRVRPMSSTHCNAVVRCRLCVKVLGVQNDSFPKKKSESGRNHEKQTIFILLIS